MDEGRQRVDVIRLEGRDVAGEELPVGIVQLTSVVELVQRCASALQRAVDRGDARLQELGHLARLPAQDLTEDEDGALARREPLERRDESEADRVSLDGGLGRIGDRLDPGDLGQRAQVRLDRLA